MEACLSAGVSYVELDDHKAREYLRRAASIADALPASALDVRKDAWLANAYLGSWTECIHAASMLARDQTNFERFAASVIACALAKVKNRKRFLENLKEGLWTIEPALIATKEAS